MKKLLLAIGLAVFSHVGAAAILAGDEINGQFEPALVANIEDLDRVVLKGISPSQIKGKLSISEDAHLAAARITDPKTKNISLLALLVEDQAMDPLLYVDTNG